ncbi:hypothetical protein GLOIN_2v1778656 [Rhizophagus irregularis DAOM 181602=DAOM 197198]|uniref:Uncharacterized protein n=1 Tax=Rhizophagus irregularis (strain DAOM 181602 / DAOM 197198 / MUCL 43194) TaxID=747089 RepID=A0A2P4PRR4_RHIID|nr:hypothetical protein GLOIN_2v1778656 [Rhizophagus irregularis DAOM 181602=DAOM 197198]POG68066.1 hypothetical protein GLOIN_2v1778656 [Rhizophagus irregularis DAOM 181602=DAOM 197198]CAG8529670.1 2156_t:CDS:2 [Rhizophagus irregularis]|eukprot:XP_025174932.1 hypothetical protein GLOIN_2v1778656 [Rhizophagus irregularis DAOM 181602=DAOM 197198]
MKSHELALVYKSDPTERNVLDPYDKNSRYSEKQKTGCRMRYRNRDFNYERVQLFDRIRIKDRTQRDRERTRPHDNPISYYEESHPHMRVPYYEYGRKADRMRAPYYDYH